MQPGSCVIIIATYNEMENLPRLVGELRGLMPNVHLLIVDDNSPDGTGDWVRQQEQQTSSITGIHRAGKLGLGSATLEGFDWAIENSYEYVATMDGDFSHAPDAMDYMLRSMMNELDDSLGVMIGSRYIAGGAIKGWPFYRMFTSRCLNGFVRLVLRLPTKDNSGAFRVYRRKALQMIHLQDINSKGYGYLEEILWRLHHAGVRMVEHPITFVDRVKGNSKTSFLVGLQVIIDMLKLALAKPKQMKPSQVKSNRTNSDKSVR